jgi:hypothetical protein
MIILGRSQMDKNLSRANIDTRKVKFGKRIRQKKSNSE